MSSPNKDPSFEVIGEGPVFEGYEYILSSTFASGSRTPQGLIILFDSAPFTDRTEIMLTTLASYFGPLLDLFRSIFLRITPSQFAIVSRAIAGLRLDAWTTQFQNELCRITSANYCRMFSTAKSFSGIPILPPDASLIRAAVSRGSPCAYRQPRKRADFNKSVDDDPMLHRITSMMILPVKETPLVVALYNSTISSEFTPIQVSIAEIFGMSLPPILKQITMTQEMTFLSQAHAQGIVTTEATVRLIPEFIRSIASDSFFKYLTEKVPRPVKCFLFAIVSDTRAVRYPDCCLVELSELLRQTADEPFTSSEIDVAVDVANDPSLVAARVVRSYDCVCLFDLAQLDQLGKVIVTLIPWVHLRKSLAFCFQAQHDVRCCGRGSAEALSRLLGFPVKCEFHDPPVAREPDTDALVQVCVETAKGIEAVLTSNVQDDGIVEFGGFLSAALTRVAQEMVGVAQLFIDCGVASVFECSGDDVERWVAWVSPLVLCKSYEPFAFLQVSLEANPWNEWFDQKSRVLILLASFLRGIEPRWHCQIAQAMVERAKGTRPASGPVLAAVFSPDCGLANGLEEPRICELIGELDQYVVPACVEAEGSVLAHLTVLAGHSFHKSEANRPWLARAFVLLPRIYHFTVDPTTLADRLVELYGTLGRTAEMFRVERVYFPMMLCLSRREDRFLQMNSVIRESLSQARKAMRD
jgi:hypothetical protein